MIHTLIIFAVVYLILRFAFGIAHFILDILFFLSLLFLVIILIH